MSLCHLPISDCHGERLKCLSVDVCDSRTSSKRSWPAKIDYEAQKQFSLFYPHFRLRYSRLVESSHYVQTYPVSFQNGLEGVNWMNSMPDARERATYSELWTAPKAPLACFIIPAENWSGNGDWHDLAWHCWAVAIVKTTKTKRKYLIIYDCGPAPARHDNGALRRRGEVLLGFQRTFVKDVQDRDAPWTKVPPYFAEAVV